MWAPNVELCVVQSVFSMVFSFFQHKYLYFSCFITQKKSNHIQISFVFITLILSWYFAYQITQHFGYRNALHRFYITNNNGFVQWLQLFALHTKKSEKIMLQNVWFFVFVFVFASFKWWFLSSNQLTIRITDLWIATVYWKWMIFHPVISYSKS